MVKTFGGKIAKFFSVILSVVLLLGCAVMFAACESKYPEISMKISFNDETYTLKYKLYRNMYKQTVAHYLELIDMDFYDGTVIHDFQSDRMVGGAYTYENLETSSADELEALDYEAFIRDGDSIKLKNISVWEDEAREIPTGRLFGETTDNGYTVDNNGLTNKYGALGTYTYLTKSNTVVARDEDGTATAYVQVWCKQTTKDAYVLRDYYKNSTTSMFYIYTSESTMASGSYCVFGELADDASKTALQDLMQAIEDYKTDMELDSFSETKEDVTIEDSLVPDTSYTVDFEVPAEKIVIDEVKVLKY